MAEPAHTDQPLCKPRSTPSTWRWAPAWCPSPATTCRCSIPTGIIAEHNWTREHAGLFDVSHMGQALPRRRGPRRRPRAALEALVPGRRRSTSSPASSATRSCSTTDGGILDDLMVDAARPIPADEGWLYPGGQCRHARRPTTRISQARLPTGVTLHRADDRALHGAAGAGGRRRARAARARGGRPCRS